MQNSIRRGEIIVYQNGGAPVKGVVLCATCENMVVQFEDRPGPTTIRRSHRAWMDHIAKEVRHASA